MDSMESGIGDSARRYDKYYMLSLLSLFVTKIAVYLGAIC